MVPDTLPLNARPPYQTVVLFPGSNAIYETSFENYRQALYSYLIKSGHAVVFPIYKSTFERRDELKSDTGDMSSNYREHVINWTREVRRAIDYIETRPDMDHHKIAFYGLSWGAVMGSLVLPLDDRINVGLLVAGGLGFERVPPEVSQINFVPRIKVPVLMVNGRYDYFFPAHSSQEPFFKALGTPNKDKRYVVEESGHVPPREALIKEVLDWLDRYFGPVAR